jgi:hypothetical protein
MIFSNFVNFIMFYVVFSSFRDRLSFREISRIIVIDCFPRLSSNALFYWYLHCIYCKLLLCSCITIIVDDHVETRVSLHYYFTLTPN